MDRPYEVIGFGREYRAGRDLSRSFSPSFPQSGESERLAVLSAHEHRLLRPTLLLPFVEPVRQDKTAVSLEGVPKRGFGRHGLGPGIYHPAADARVVRPRRDQPPTQRSHPPSRVVAR